MNRADGRRFRVDRELKEMAKVFRMPFGTRLLYLYLPAIFGYARGAEGTAQQDGGDTEPEVREGDR